jgi:FixJ family two-component response regulator
MTQSVLIVDDDEDLRVTLADVMSAVCHVDCVALPDVAAMIRDAERALACTLAIIDVNLGAGQPTGLDAQAWLTSHGFHGRIVLLTGHARTHPLVKRALEAGATQVLQKPTSIKILQHLLEDVT